MRKLNHVSPSGLQCWIKNREEFYLRYLAENRPPREEQSRPMSVGSAFDAYIKVWLAERCGLDIGIDFDELFKKQVEPVNRDWARDAGRGVFELYKASATCGVLLSLLLKAQSVSMETTERGVSVDGVVLLGKPDLYFTTAAGVRVMLDWKVNGYCSAASPMSGYKGHGGWSGWMEGDVEINSGWRCKEDWRIQLYTYGVLVGGVDVHAIDQITYRGGVGRVTEHKGCLGGEGIMEAYKEVWGTCASGWIFRDLSEDESRRRGEVLDSVHAAYSIKDSVKRDFVKKVLGR